MKENIMIEFTEDELKDILINHFGLEEDEFDINDYTDEEIKQALLESVIY
jgi:peptide subunit release factor 1 (eRF1)